MLLESNMYPMKCERSSRSFQYDGTHGETQTPKHRHQNQKHHDDVSKCMLIMLGLIHNNLPNNLISLPIVSCVLQSLFYWHQETSLEPQLLVETR